MVSIRMTGDHLALVRKLRNLSELDLAGLNESLAQGVRTSTKQRFKTQTDPEGKRWKPSIRAKETKGKTLVKTARLLNSIRAQSDSSGFTVGTNVIYAGRHQQGDKRPMTIRPRRGKYLRFKVGGRWVNAKKVRVQLPARPFLGLSEEDIGEIRQVIESTVKEA